MERTEEDEGRYGALSSTLNIDLAAVSTLLDDAVVNGAVCRSRASEQLTKGKIQGAQCRK